MANYCQNYCQTEKTAKHRPKRKTLKPLRLKGFLLVEHRRFELLTPTLPVLCATNCANAPSTLHIISQNFACVKPLFQLFCMKRQKMHRMG